MEDAGVKTIFEKET
jgi:hypothetical protein